MSPDNVGFIEKEVTGIIAPLGFEIIELKLSRSRHGTSLQFLIDRTEGGITLDECADLNKRIGALLESKNIMMQHYTLEVASPGLDRNLKTERDFRRMTDKVVHIYVRDAVDDRLEFEGIVVGVGGGAVTIRDTHDTETTISIDNINKAKQLIL